MYQASGEEAEVMGFASIFARIMVSREQVKPFFRRPYIRWAQLSALAVYFTEVGCFLGVKYAGQLTAFANAFLGVRGDLPTLAGLFEQCAAEVLATGDLASMSFYDYVQASEIQRLGISGGESEYFRKFGFSKHDPSIACQLIRTYARNGATIGVVGPEIALSMINNSRTPVSEEKWAEMRRAGVDIPQKQVIDTSEEAEATYNNSFLQYCQECCPAAYDALNDH
jgi:hypothetical protein